MHQVLQKNLRDILSKNNLSVSELERRAGLKQRAIQNILMGRSTNPGIDIISQLAKNLGCSIEELISEQTLDIKKSEKKPEPPNHFPWNPILFNNTFEFVNQFITEKKITPPINKVLDCIREIYSYCFDNDKNVLDKKFAEWIVNNRFSNKEF